MGVGGLIHAYKTAAKEAIENGEIVELEVFEWIKIQFDYSNMPQIMNLIKQNQLETKDQLFENTCSLVIQLPLNTSNYLQNELNEIENIEIENLGIY